MLPAVQNQDLVQRSDTMSEMRAHEQGKAFGDMAKSAAEMHRLNALKENSVQKDEGTEALNADGGGNSAEEQEKKKKQKGDLDSESEINTPAGHPLKLEGGDMLDLLA